MARYERFAVYYLPPEGDFADFGAAWLGWDMVAGAPCPHPDLPGLPKPIATLTQKPRRYGFHATIKAPFHLAEGCSPDGLDASLAGLCTRLAPVQIDGLTLSTMGGCAALIPQGDVTALNALAAEVVRGLDEFRAPAGAVELARRRLRHLSERQEANLMAWGYPYVMDEFGFHITLTGSMKPALAKAVKETLTPVLDDLLPRPLMIDALSLVGQDSEGFFHLIHRYPLTGGAG
ncbi:MAG: DUF1045 domain-containing protein [Mangrovicoccus sp.]|nr:DUF1045 domain-containing protein [Mangrovicoccus sp.]